MGDSKDKKSIFIRGLKSPWPWILGLLFLCVYFFLGEIIALILPYTKYYYVPNFGAEVAANYLRPDISWPLSNYVKLKGANQFLLIPFYIILGYIIMYLHLIIKPYYKYLALSVLIVVLFLRVLPGTLLLLDSNEHSQAYGRPTNGQIENSRRMPFSKKGYKTYSFWSYLLGRTYVHEKLKKTFLLAAEIHHEQYSEYGYVLGDCSLKNGGPMAFQEGKQNGLQIDLLLPLREGEHAYQKSSISNFWNYDLELQSNGIFEGGLEVNYPALASQLSTLYQVSRKNDLKIKKIDITSSVFKKVNKHSGISFLSAIAGFSTSKDVKNSPAYYTVTFSEPTTLKERVGKWNEFRKRKKTDE